MRRYKWTIIVAGAIIAVLFAAPLLLMHQVLDRHISYDKLYSGTDFGVEVHEQLVKTQDELNIALYEVKADKPQALVLTLSGIEKPSVTAFMGHAALFQKHGYSTIMIEMRAHGQSNGERICLGYKETLDVGAALAYVNDKEEYRGLPVVVMGLSMGAGTAINAMAEYPEIDALISLSAFSSCEETFSELLGQSMPPLAASVIKPFLYSATFLRYGRAVRLKPVKSITALNGRPALLMHTTQDSNVAYDNFLRLKAVAPKHVETHSFEGDEHFITPDFLQPERDERYASILLRFLESLVHKDEVSKQPKMF